MPSESWGQSTLVGLPEKILKFRPSETPQKVFPRFLSIQLELAKPNFLKIKALLKENSSACRQYRCVEIQGTDFVTVTYRPVMPVFH